MRTIKPWNALLWVLNAALGAFIVLFFFKHLLPPADDLRDVRLDEGIDATADAQKPPLSDQALLLKNPITSEKDRPPAEENFVAVLKGTLGAAFLKSAATNAELVAFAGEKIKSGEYAGWTLQEVWKDRALFTGPQGRTRVLTVETAPRR